MANNYTESSSFLPIPPDKLEMARVIIDRVTTSIKTDPDGCEYCGCDAEVQGDGVWFHGDESVNPEHIEKIARALIEELDLPGPFYCSWANTCSKPRIDEFGGGAFVLAKGVPTIWCDARCEVERQYNELTESQKN